MNHRISNPAREDIMEELESNPVRESEHLDCHGQEVPVPHLELLVASRYELGTCHIADYHKLNGLLLTFPSQRGLMAQWKLFVTEGFKQVCDASWETPLSKEEIVNIYQKHCILKIVYKPFLVVHVFSNNLPVNSIAIGATIRPFLITT